MNEKTDWPIDNILDGLTLHADFLTEEERIEELRARGVDVDKFLTDAYALIGEYKKERRLSWMKDAREKQQLLAGDSVGFISWVGKSQDEIMAAFQSLLKTALPQETLAFRNRTDLTVEDMARILDDYERLHKMAGDQKPPQEQQ